MAPSTLEQTPPTAPAASVSADAWALVRRYAWPLGVLVVLGISTGIVLWARTRPGFDPYGWLVWGHQTIHGSLDTNAAPSWKPLPYLFTVPYGLFGHYELWLWMITVVAASLAGCIFAGRIAYRLTAAPQERRWTALAAGVFAALALLGIQDYWHYILSSQSDPVIVSLCLAAIDCHLARRYRWTLVLGVLASLGRPEAWPFLGLWALWAWFALPRMRRLLVVGVAFVPLLWLGVPALTSRSPFVAASNAFGSGRRLRSDQVFGTIKRFLALHEPGLEVLALVSLGLAVLRRDLTTLVLAAGVIGWVVVEIAFALHGWPGLGRYMFEGAGVMVALAGAGFGRLLLGAPELPPLPVRMLLGGVAALAFLASLVPPAVSRARAEHRDLRSQRARTHQINQLAGVVRRLGGPARFRPCGEPLTRLEYQTILAFTLQRNVARIGFKYGPAVRSGRPIVLFTPSPGSGWRVQAVHQRVASCRTLPR